MDFIDYKFYKLIGICALAFIFGLLGVKSGIFGDLFDDDDRK